MECSLRRLKFFVSALSLLVVLVAILNAVMGKVYTNLFRTIPPEIRDHFTYSLLSFILLSVVMFVLAAMGILTAVTQNLYFLLVYQYLLPTLFIVQIGMPIKIMIHLAAGRDLDYQLNIYFNEFDYAPETQPMINALQRNFRCCGIDGPNYWQPNIPSSCCKFHNCARVLENLNQTGCNEVIRNRFRMQAAVLFGLFGFAIIVEICIIICCRKMRKLLKEQVRAPTPSN